MEKISTVLMKMTKTILTFIKDPKVVKFSIETLKENIPSASLEVKAGEKYGWFKHKTAKEDLYSVYPDYFDPGKLYTKKEIIENFGYDLDKPKEIHRLILTYNNAAQVIKEFDTEEQLYECLKKVCPDYKEYTPIELL